MLKIIRLVNLRTVKETQARKQMFVFGIPKTLALGQAHF